MGSYPPESPSRRFCLRTPDMRRRLRQCGGAGQAWAAAPATYLLVGINCAVFLAMVLNGVSIGSPDRRAADALGREQRRLRAVSTASGGASLPPCLCTSAFFTWPPTCGACGTWRLLAEPLMGSCGRACGLHPHRRGGQPALHADVNWFLPDSRRAGAGLFPAGRGCIGRGLRNCRRADCPAQVESTARAARRS